MKYINKDGKKMEFIVIVPNFVDVYKYYKDSVDCNNILHMLGEYLVDNYEISSVDELYSHFGLIEDDLDEYDREVFVEKYEECFSDPLVLMFNGKETKFSYEFAGDKCFVFLMDFDYYDYIEYIYKYLECDGSFVEVDDIDDEYGIYVNDGSVIRKLR